MKEEIKEILRILKAKSTRYEYCLKENIPYNDENYEAHLLYDCITNLKEENKRLKEDFKLMGSACVTFKNDFINYKSRIDKAIDYIKERYDYILKCDFLDHDEQVDKRQITYLLNILQGEDKE